MLMEAHEGLNRPPKQHEIQNISMVMPFVKTHQSEFSTKMRLYITWNLKAFTSIMMFFPWNMAIDTTNALFEQKYEEFNKSILR